MRHTENDHRPITHRVVAIQVRIIIATAVIIIVAVAIRIIAPARISRADKHRGGKTTAAIPVTIPVTRVLRVTDTG